MAARTTGIRMPNRITPADTALEERILGALRNGPARLPDIVEAINVPAPAILRRLHSMGGRKLLTSFVGAKKAIYWTTGHGMQGDGDEVEARQNMRRFVRAGGQP